MPDEEKESGAAAGRKAPASSSRSAEEAASAERSFKVGKKALSGFFRHQNKDIVSRFYGFYMRRVGNEFRDFCEKRKGLFKKDLAARDGEYPLDWTLAFEEFSTLMDGLLKEFCESEHINEEDLVGQLSELTADNPKGKALVKLIAAFEDFRKFAEFMTDHAKVLLADSEGEDAGAAAASAPTRKKTFSHK